MFRPIDATDFEKPEAEFAPGPCPTLIWIKIDELIVDGSYQREIGRRGRANIRTIAETFEWSKFAPVIVASVEGGRYAVVDGQHRTTAASLRGIEQVPCQLIQADQLKQAQAYAAVNGAITKTTPQQLFHAKVAARDAETSAIQGAVQIAGVFVTKRNRVAAEYDVGETQAIGAITRCYKKYGRDTLITALQCITQTSDGNAGWVRSTIVEALCIVLNKRQDWRDAGVSLLRAMDDFNFIEEWDRASAGKNVVLSRAVVQVFVARLAEHLEVRLKTSVNASYVDKETRKARRQELKRAA